MALEALKDLPSYNKDNFSRFTQGVSKSPLKPYIRLKSDGPEEKPRIIVTDNETLLHKELEMLALRTKRKSRKRTSLSSKGDSGSWVKHAKIDSDSNSVATVDGSKDELLLSESSNSSDSEERMT